MLLALEDVAPRSYYQTLADEIETIADSVLTNPRHHAQLAARLKELAEQIRDDARLVALKARLD